MDTDQTEYLTMGQAAKTLPYKLSAAAIWRWCQSGIKAKDGTIVRLEHRRFGRKYLTTKTWMDEFGSELATRNAKPVSKHLPAATNSGEIEALCQAQGI